MMRTALVAATMATIAIAVPASAHDAVAYQGKDWSETYADHTYIAVHDMECDGNPVYVKWKEKGHPGRHSITDLNGCSAGGSYQFLGHNHEVAYFRTCEIDDSPEGHFVYCGSWAHYQA